MKYKVTKSIILINIILYLISLAGPYTNILALFPIGSDIFFKFQTLSYMFVHMSFNHILLNLIMLILVGPSIEKTLGGRKYLMLYILSGIVGGMSHAMTSQHPVIGASAAIWGVMATYAAMFPNQVVNLYFIIPVKIKYIIGLLLLNEFILTIIGQLDGTSHIAHIFGAITGILCYIFYKKSGILQ